MPTSSTESERVFRLSPVPIPWLKATPGVVPSDDYPPSLKKLEELRRLQPRIDVKSFGPGHHFLAEEDPARVVELVVAAIAGSGAHNPGPG